MELSGRIATIDSTQIESFINWVGNANLNQRKDKNPNPNFAGWPKIATNTH